ncbi:MAG TPA: ABC transporter ATP-binding protein [Actinomycetaceae bacterium]|nr:ABC transporter ATP-binding protein [Actinomycetaceae bacterium]
MGRYAADLPVDAPGTRTPAHETRQPADVAPGLLPEGTDLVATARGLTKIYGEDDTEVVALGGVDIDFARGSFTAIMGPSGSGKSTMMHTMAGLDSVTAGDIVVDGMRISEMNQRQLTRVRRDHIGFVFQAYNLVPTLTAEENITLPLDIARADIDREWFDHIVDVVGLGDRLTHRPSELSGGQQQRVACARALVGRPSIVFADEPTGNLDSRAAGEVLGFLRRSVDDFGQSVVIVTHEPTAAAYSDRVIFLADGLVVEELTEPTVETILDTLGRLNPAKEVA